MATAVGIIIELGFMLLNIGLEGSPSKGYAKQTPSDTSFLQNQRSEVGHALEVPGQQDRAKAFMVGSTCIMCLMSSISFLCSLMMLLFSAG